MKLLSSAKPFIYGFITLFCLMSISFAKPIMDHDVKLVNYTDMGEFSKEQARLALQKMPPLDTLEIKYSVHLYKIHYKTPAPNGEITIASGLVAMPALLNEKAAIVSYLHGTRVARKDVPSNNDEKNYIYPATFGNSGGYMVVMPDYLGLGDNDLSLHPYVQADTLASSSIDMLMAAKELAKKLDYQINDKLYIAGYSEGGFSTMVMYESLLNDHPELPVTAVAAGSAPYDWHETIPFVALEPGPRATVYLALFFYSMQTYYHYWHSLDEIFIEPYNTLIPILFDGSHLLPEILQALPLEPRKIFQKNFFEGILDGSDSHTDQLAENFNHYHFKARSPLLLVGTKGDHDVPFHGAEIAYQVLKSQSDMVYLKHVSEVLDHVEAFPYVTKEQLEFFKYY